jgi:hypothetical protein
MLKGRSQLDEEITCELCIWDLEAVETRKLTSEIMSWFSPRTDKAIASRTERLGKKEGNTRKTQLNFSIESI